MDPVKFPAGTPRGFGVRRLGAGDLAAMHALLTVFSRVFEDPESYDARRPDAAWLGGLLARDTFVALVAEHDGQVIGGLAAYQLHKFEQARSEFYIYDLAVDAAHRRRGVATSLIAALQAIAAEAGGGVIYVQADTGEEDAAAIALYSRLGTREEVLHFDIPVRRGA